jgi:hypothetical protein
MQVFFGSFFVEPWVVSRVFEYQQANVEVRLSGAAPQTTGTGLQAGRRVFDFPGAVGLIRGGSALVNVRHVRSEYGLAPRSWSTARHGPSGPG